MAYSVTYNTLKSDILAWTDEDSAEFDAIIDRVIGLAENRVLRDLDLQSFQDLIAIAAVVPNTSEQALPTGLLVPKSSWVTVGANDYRPILQRSEAFVRDYAFNCAADVPVYWSFKKEGKVDFAPRPDSAYVIQMYGIVRPAGLDAGHANTWLGDNVGDLLLLACLIEAEQFLIATAPVAKWKGDYADKKTAAQKEFANLVRSEFMAGYK